MSYALSIIATQTLDFYQGPGGSFLRMGTKFTRHGLSQIADSDKVPSEDIVGVPLQVRSILGDFLTEFEPSDVFPRFFETLDIARYLGEIDPMSLVDSETQTSSEYLVEAQALVWLFDHHMFNRETFWAIWIYFFTEEISPFNSQDDELMLAMFAAISIIFQSRLTEEERLKLAHEAENPWLGASIAATKYQMREKSLLEAKRDKLRKP